MWHLLWCHNETKWLMHTCSGFDWSLTQDGPEVSSD